MRVKDVTLFHGGETVVTGNPIEIAKLKHEGWTEMPPAVRKPVAPAPKPIKLPEVAPKPAPESK